MDALGITSALVQLSSSFPNTELVVLAGQCNAGTVTRDYTQIDQYEMNGPINAISNLGTKSMSLDQYAHSPFSATSSILAPLTSVIAIDTYKHPYGNETIVFQSYISISGSIVKLFVNCLDGDATKLSTSMLSCVMPLIVYH